MEINPEQILRSGKHAGKTIGWIMRFDRKYFEWVRENTPGMLKEHKDYKQKPSPYANGYGPNSGASPFRDNELAPDRPQTYKKTYGGYGGSSYKSNEEKIRENFERWSDPSSWNRTFEEPPDTGMSRYDLRSSLSWGKPAGDLGNVEEED